MSVLVLGIGNLLLGDEAVGVRAVEALEARYRLADTVDVVDGGTAGMGLLDLIASRSAVIVVDAVKMDLDPGTVVRLEGERIPVGFRQRMSPHTLGLGDVLAVLTVLDQAPAELVVIGVEPDNIDYGVGLSPVVTARLDTVVDAIVAELVRLGLPPKKVPEHLPPSGP
jgi:hydrogenase expression/formation protein